MTYASAWHCTGRPHRFTPAPELLLVRVHVHRYMAACQAPVALVASVCAARLVARSTLSPIAASCHQLRLASLCLLGSSALVPSVLTLHTVWLASL